MIRKYSDVLPQKYYDPTYNSARAIFLRELDVLLVSLIIGFLLVSVLRRAIPRISFGANLFIKILILVAAAMIMNFLIYSSFEMLIQKKEFSVVWDRFIENTFKLRWLLPKLTEWVILFLLTLLALEINEKYSRGVFFDIMLGRYIQPKEENRIIMFIDLRNSTPIAEKLGHKEYFQFIRDFIFCISAGIMEHDGRIYHILVTKFFPGGQVQK